MEIYPETRVEVWKRNRSTLTLYLGRVFQIDSFTRLPMLSMQNDFEDKGCYSQLEMEPQHYCSIVRPSSWITGKGSIECLLGKET